MSEKSTIAQFSSNIKTYRAVIGSVVVLGYLGVYSYLWVSNSVSDVHTGLLALVVVVSLIGLYGEGAVKAAKKIIK